MGKYATLTQIASLLKVDPRTINRWSDPKDRIHIPGFGPEGKGQYDIVKNVHARIEDYERRITEAQSSFKNAKERKENVNTQLLELELAEKRKELIRVDETAGLLDKIINIIKIKPQSTRKTLMPKLLIAKDDKAVLKILETRDNELLNELSTTIENIIRGLAESSGENYSAPRSVKTKRRRKS